MIGQAFTPQQEDAVRDLVIDDRGRITIPILSHGEFLGIGGRQVVVPLEALSREGKGHFALYMSKDQFAAAPLFDNQWASFSDRFWTDNLYRYYGVQPTWSDTEMTGPGKSFQAWQSSQPQMGIGALMVFRG